jgi:hypothetical protein
MATDVEMISVEAACGIIGGEANPIHKATYYRGVRAGRYPAPVRVSPGVSRVVKPQLVEAIQRMIAGKRALGGAQ